MQYTLAKRFFALIILGLSLFPLNAEDKRTIPLDLYLIIDGSAALKSPKNDVLTWINEQVVDRILSDGDKITILSAGEEAQTVYSETVSAAGKAAIKDSIRSLGTDGKTADFNGALRDVNTRLSQTPSGRLSVTMLITGSAEILEPAMAGNAQGLLRWFRSEKYERWQVLVVAPNIGRKVQNAASAYMSAIR